jgi:putative methyltransferase (TIGR04325 family)
MQIKPREIAKLLIPPLLARSYHHLTRKKGNNSHSVEKLYLDGDYPSWDKAMAASTGYDSEIILEKTKVALLKVKNGEAVYERDSVLFDQIQYAWPVLAGLMWSAASNGGNLNVLDFGGSLGSTYFQNRRFFAGLESVRWNIVEQVRQVETGKRWFQDDHLKFYPSIQACLADTKPQVILLSSVLQYLEKPYEIFAELLKTPCKHLIIDRTPFWSGPSDRLCVQHVPPSIYPASYPSWIFSQTKFYAWLSKDWQVMVTFDNPDRLAGPIEFSYQGLILVRKNHLS